MQRPRLPKYNFNQTLEVFRAETGGYHARWTKGDKGDVVSISHTGRGGSWFYQLERQRDMNGYLLSCVEGVVKPVKGHGQRPSREWMDQAWMLYGVSIETLISRLMFFAGHIDDDRPFSKRYMQPGQVKLVSVPRWTSQCLQPPYGKELPRHLWFPTLAVEEEKRFIMSDGPKMFALSVQPVDVIQGPGISWGDPMEVGWQVSSIELLP